LGVGKSMEKEQSDDKKNESSSSCRSPSQPAECVKTIAHGYSQECPDTGGLHEYSNLEEL
jgi:hypothetical protein